MSAPENGATLDDIYTKLEALTTAVGAITVDPPVGGATEAKQDDIIAALATVAIDTTGLALETKQDTLITNTDRTADAVETMRDSTDKAPVYSESLRVSTTFNRPADVTAYTIGDLIANSTTGGSVTPMTFADVAASSGGKGLIRAVKIDKTGTATATVRAHFWSASPTTATGDNAAFAPIKAGYLGYIDVILAAFSDGAVGLGLGEVPFDLTASTTVYCLLEARTAFTPTSASTYTVDVVSWPEA